MTRAQRCNTKKEFAILIIIVRVRECFNTRFKIYHFSYQSLNGICKVQPHEFVFIGIGLIGRRPWPSPRWNPCNTHAGDLKNDKGVYAKKIKILNLYEIVRQGLSTHLITRGVSSRAFPYQFRCYCCSDRAGHMETRLKQKRD